LSTYFFEFLNFLSFSGGQGYSLATNPWAWLTSQSAAEAMADQVAKWPELFNCDGIDLVKNIEA